MVLGIISFFYFIFYYIIFDNFFNNFFKIRSLFNASPNDIVEENSTELLTNKNDGSISKPLAIILEPAKDLAEQVSQFKINNKKKNLKK